MVAKAAGFKPLIPELIFVMPPKRLAEHLRRSRAMGSSFESQALRLILKQLKPRSLQVFYQTLPRKLLNLSISLLLVRR